MENGSAVKRPTASGLHSHSNHHLNEADVDPRNEPCCTPSCPSTPQDVHVDLDQDNNSLTSQDSGIPTLEIHPPEPHGYRQADDPHDSPATLPLDDDDDPSETNTVRKSSTFPRSSYDSGRFFSPGLRLPSAVGVGVGSRALNRSDDISVCSVSSMSTELSVSNEDILGFTVTSDSSAIVTLETDNSVTSHFSEVTLSPSPGNPRGSWSAARPHPGTGGVQQEEDGRQKRLGSLVSLFNRYVTVSARACRPSVWARLSSVWFRSGFVPSQFNSSY